MKIIRKEIKVTSRSDEFEIIPIGDVHIGAAACDEEKLQSTINYIKNRKNAYFVGLGDYADFINMKDPRFDIEILADWMIEKDNLADIAKAQRNRFMEYTRPIASKCLGLLQGNHEASITKHYERDVYSEIVSKMKEAGKMPPEEQLGIGYYGWLLLDFISKDRTVRITINLHHGFVGGKLAGAKALNMQRWLWTHDCDICIMGHSHNTGGQVESVERVNKNGNLESHVRRGVYAGTFLRSTNEGASTYSERKGYFPLPISGAMITLRPHSANLHERVRITI